MFYFKKRMACFIGCFLLLFFVSCTPKPPSAIKTVNAKEAYTFLMQLKGKWVVNGGKEGIFFWEFDTTSRGNVLIERLKKGALTEMLTIYHIDKGNLVANHFCQLQNQPKLIASNLTSKKTLDFLCTGSIGGTENHNALHMHGVHFQKKETSIIIWMDMFKNNKKDFETKYELFRIGSSKANELMPIN